MRAALALAAAVVVAGGLWWAGREAPAPLLGTAAIDMGIILSKSTRPSYAMHNSRLFISINSSELKQSQW